MRRSACTALRRDAASGRAQRPPAGAHLYVPLGDPGPKSIVPDAYRAGLVTGTGHDMLRVGPVKIFTDGSAGGRTPG